MKKLFLILAVVTISAASFAQVQAPKAIKKSAEPVMFGNQPVQTTAAQQKNGAASFWFEFTSALENYYGQELDGFGPPIQCDSLGLFPFTDGNAHVQFMSVGQVFDWPATCWNDFYNGQDLYAGVSVPYLAQTNSYSIDSIRLCYYYHRGTNVDASVVDTLAVSYVTNLDGEPIHQPSTSAGPAFSTYYVPYNENTYMASMTSGDGDITLGSSVNIVYDKIPLTAEDATDSTYFYYVTIPAPAGLTNVTAKEMAIMFTFIPGVARTTASVIGTDLSTFRTILSDDPRTEYTTYGTQELLSDKNMGLYTDADNFIPTDGWYGIYKPNIFWQGNPKTYLGVKVTCNDCAIVNVAEMEAQNITVRPNPATNNITVNLAGEGQAHIQLFNLVGQLVYSETATSATTINVANLHSGVYMLKVSQNGKVYTSKVVVK